MKNSRIIALLLCLTSTAAINSFAAENNGPYFGLKTGSITHFFFSSEPTNAFTLGYDFGSWGLEYERMRGAFKELAPLVSLSPAAGNREKTKFRVRGNGLFATYRLGRTWQFKSKLGMMDQSIKPDFNDESGLKLAGGMGLGIDWSHVRLDFEATYVAGDGNSYVTAGLLFKFNVGD